MFARIIGMFAFLALAWLDLRDIFSSDDDEDDDEDGGIPALAWNRSG